MFNLENDEELIGAYVALTFLPDDSAEQFIQDNSAAYHATETILLFQEISTFIQSILSGLVAAYLYDKAKGKRRSIEKKVERDKWRVSRKMEQLEKKLDPDDEEDSEVFKFLDDYDDLLSNLTSKEVEVFVEEAISDLRAGKRKEIEDEIRR